ncbi:MAG: DUF2597 family protein [Desulfotalea sp.]
MHLRISNASFSFMMGDFKLIAEKATLSIEDGTTAVTDGGVPNGYVTGAVSASGEIELDAAAMGVVGEAAKAAGAWQLIEPIDLMWFAKGTQEEEKIECFGCKLKITDLPDYDPSGDKKAVVKIPYEVTSPDFVRINGIPYLDPARTKDLV